MPRFEDVAGGSAAPRLVLQPDSNKFKEPKEPMRVYELGLGF